MSGACMSSGQNGGINPMQAGNIVMPLYDYCGVELMDISALEGMNEYFSHPSRFLLGLDESLTLGEFIKERERVLESEADEVTIYPIYIEGRPKKPFKGHNDRKIYEVEALDRLRDYRLSPNLKIKDIVLGIKMGIERYCLEEAVLSAAAFYPKYHCIINSE